MSAAEVVVYTTKSCTYCVRAKRLLSQRGIDFREVDVTGDDAARAALVERSGRQTVPQIWVGSTHVGGCGDLEELIDDNQLEPLLQREGIHRHPVN